MDSGRNDALDGLRALAALAVLFFHTGVPGWSGGGRGVDVFFVLSGFLVTRMLLDKSARLSMRSFWERRARRLYPALLAFLVIYSLVGPLLFQRSTGSVALEALTAALYLTDITAPLRQDPLPLNHTWSLAVEAQFYLLWPLVLPMLMRRRDPARVLLMAWGGVTFLRAAIAPLSSQIGSFSPLHGTGLLIGAIVAFQPPSPRGAPIGLVALAMVFIFAHPGADVWGVPVTELATASLLPALLSPCRIARAFAWKPAAWLGVMSYGVYLWHAPLAAALVGSPFSAPITLTVSVILAAASYYLIERHFLHRVSGSNVQAPTAPAPAGASSRRRCVTPKQKTLWPRIPSWTPLQWIQYLTSGVVAAGIFALAAVLAVKALLGYGPA